MKLDEIKSSKSYGFGMVQGRLIKSPQNQLQWFPQPYWEAEFFIAGALGFDYIELLAERSHNPENPIWTSYGIEQIRHIAEMSGLTLPIFCNDFVIDNSLLNNKDCLSQNLRLIERGSLLGCKKFILPLFEQSELKSSNISDFIMPIQIIADSCHNHDIELCLETLLEGNLLIEALHEIGRPEIRVVFDTGNRAAYGHDLKGDITLLNDYISHVHIKDKNERNENVVLGTGKVNFEEVTEALNIINYSGLFTFETSRGKDPIKTAKHNLNFMQYFLNKTN